MPTKGKILVVVSGLKGLMLSSFSIVKQLKKMNYHVLWSSINGDEEWAKTNQIESIKLPNFFSSYSNQSPTKSSILKKVIRLIYRYINYKKRFKQSIQELKIDELADIFSREQFDLIITDFELHEVVLAGYKANTKVVLLSPWFHLLEYDGIAPISSKSDYKLDTIDRSNEWIKMRSMNKKKEAKFNFRNGFVSRKIALKTTADSIGFRKEHWIEYTWPQPFYYQNIPILSTAIKEFDYPNPNNKNINFIGPQIDLERKHPSTQLFNIQPILDAKSSHKKIILITITSMNNERPEIVSIISKIANKRQDWFFIISPLKNEYVHQASNLILANWIPQNKLLRIADLSINHGGLNTINECIYHQVPMLIFSGNKHDQNGCMARSVYHGLAKSGQSLENLEDEIEEVLNDDTIKKNLSVFKNYITSNEQEKQLEKTIQKLLR